MLQRLFQRRNAGKWVVIAAACAGIALLFSADAAAQCAMCRTALTQSAEGQRWSRGINAGIMLLLAAPFAIAGVILLVIFQSRLASAAGQLRERLLGSKELKSRPIIPQHSSPVEE